MPDMVVAAEFPGLEDHFEMSYTARLFNGGDFVADLLVLACEEGAAIDYHIDLIRAGLHRQTDVLEFDLQRHRPTWECRGYGCDFHAAIPDKHSRSGNEIRVDADGRTTRHLITPISRL